MPDLRERRLSSVHFPDTLKTIGQEAFTDNYFKNIVFPNALETIETGAFQGNSYLESVTFGSKLKKIGKSAFQSADLRNLNLPSSLREIGAAAFNRNKLPDEQAFIYKKNADGSDDRTTVVSYGGEKVDGVLLPSNVRTIGELAFAGTWVKDIIF